MSLELPYSIRILDASPVDFWYGPYDTIGEALATIPEPVRLNRTIKIGSVEYWWDEGTADEDLVVKTAGVVGSATTRNGGNIELNMKGFPDVLFFTVDPITTNETVQFAGVDNAVRAVWVFTIESGGSIQFPSVVKSTDVRMNPTKKWTPYDEGTYKATLIKNAADWLLDNIEGPYV